jgi:cation diffusion facilitator CzcD-associated flavoprotein CzcO
MKILSDVAPGSGKRLYTHGAPLSIVITVNPRFVGPLLRSKSTRGASNQQTIHMMENGNSLGSNSDPVASTYARGRQNGIPLNKQPLLEPRRIKVVCVGAGYSGLILAYKVKHQMKLDSFIDLKIYEKNDDVGGTWLENRYPGVACDVPAHVYTFCWEPNPDWSRFYASGPEIWEYIRRTTTKYKLDDFIEFKSRVVESIWDETTSRWKIKVDQGGKTIDTEADVLVNASGILNKWVWPEIEGLRHFKGTLLHSAAWDLTADWSGKRIGLIGNGSSAIQILPQVQPTASHVVNYIRSATWISLNFHQKYAPEGTNLIFTEEQKQRFHDHPEELTEYRKAIEHE